jgi:hypothetical protein
MVPMRMHTSMTRTWRTADVEWDGWSTSFGLLWLASSITCLSFLLLRLWYHGCWSCRLSRDGWSKAASLRVLKNEYSCDTGKCNTLYPFTLLMLATAKA